MCVHKNYLSNLPCTLTKDLVQKHSVVEIISMYKPALVNDGVNIDVNPPTFDPIDICQHNRRILQNHREVRNLQKSLRYVWCDGYESATWEMRNCRYLGIRLTKDFILHEAVWPAFVCGDHIESIINKCHARLITQREFLLLSYVWQEISEMRVIAGDTPLPAGEKWFWYMDVDALNKAWFDKISFNGEKNYLRDYPGCVLLAVTSTCQKNS